ncbi:hypothetical protein ACFWSF_04735 [Streptomyces sp. NPDC058611]|uniref:hypothetical protein n=1 Tax=unclassified Streptomyces TaxID=2593676 RepID=UPI00364A8476
MKRVRGIRTRTSCDNGVYWKEFGNAPAGSYYMQIANAPHFIHSSGRVVYNWKSSQTMSVLSCHGVTKSFRKHSVLEGVHLSLEAAEIVGLLGLKTVRARPP